MRALLLILAAWPCSAVAFPGLFATPDGRVPPAGAARLGITRQAQTTTLTVVPWLSEATGRLGIVIPITSPDVSRLNTLPHAWFDRVEAFAAPRLARITCDDLVDESYYTSPPGCTSYTPRPPPPVGDHAEAWISPSGARLEGGWALSVVTVDAQHDGLQVWLDTEDLALPASVAPLVDAHATGGGAFVVGVTTFGDPTSGWLDPIQVAYSDPAFEIPVAWTQAAAPEALDVVITAVTDAPLGGLEIANYPDASLEDGCMLAPEDLETWHDGALDIELSTYLPSVLVEYGGIADRCAPCVGGPLEAYELLDLGWRGDPGSAWITRLHLRTDTARLDQALQLVVRPATERTVTYVSRRTEIEFAFPECGAGFPRDPELCEGLSPPGSGGCAVVGHGGGWVALLVPLAVARRRRIASGLVLLCLTTTPARAETGPPIRMEVLGSAAVSSTDRVRFQDLPRGGPHLPTMPMLGVGARATLPFPAARRIAATMGLRGFVGGATPGAPERAVSFRFVEPHAGLDARWGAPGRRRVVPTVRTGLACAVGIVDTNVWRPRATAGALLHVSGGLFVGRGARPAIVEIQAAAVPRTDGYATTFHPNVGLSDWLYFPGTADLSLLGGVAFR